ncbi:DNA polymerase III subunit delta' [Duffyella gerundensis]|uniref:DNA polymerase III subunit delta' n=1 Tax=Duffyella gerundensis TaxID=1619313 RepID=UPI0016540FC6|nr:DNA polymerase III subunit delta' [Duffyella gerundensis]
MSWYPWLNQPYRQIVAQLQAGRGHHALLISALPGMGDEALVWGISRWLMCQRPDGLKSCGECHGCQLMMASTHPDWYRLEAEKGKSSLGIDAVRAVNEKLYNFAQQGGAKIVWLPDAAQLTEAAANALLKTLEEPPAKTWFFLSCREPSRLLATIRSRCLSWPLLPPDEAQSQAWLARQQEVAPEAALTALRLSAGAPGAALTLLEARSWQARDGLCDALSDAIQHDIMRLLPLLNHDDHAQRLAWLISLLVDALKWQQGAGEFISNCDRQALVASLAGQMPASALTASLQEWTRCRDRLLQINAVNRELLLTEQLLNWSLRLKPARIG